MVFSGICALYERKLRELSPAMRNITYDIEDLYNFIDGLADMSALVYVSILILTKLLIKTKRIIDGITKRLLVNY